MKTEKWAAYLRVSTADQDLENQRADIDNFAARQGVELDWFEEVESTRKTRPVKQNLLQKVRKGEYTGIIVWQLSRWARSMPELAPELEELTKIKVKFVSVRDLGLLDPSSSTGTLMVNIIGSFAQFERDIIRERTMAGLARAAKEGRKGGRPKGSKDKVDRRKSGYYLRYAKGGK
jgi:DNA invertase Pin-like site-specific DNA recombinase